MNQCVIKPAVKEINALTNFFVEVEQKREGRRIGFLKFRISRLKVLPTAEPTQASLFPDMEDLPALANILVEAGVVRREAEKIADQEWKAVAADVQLEAHKDFEAYVQEKIGLANQAMGVKNIGGFIVKAIRENYQDPALQAQLAKRKAKEQAGMLDASNPRRWRNGTRCSAKPCAPSPNSLSKPLRKSSPTLSVNDWTVTIPSKKRTTTAGWSQRSSTPFSLKRSV